MPSGQAPGLTPIRSRWWRHRTYVGGNASEKVAPYPGTSRSADRLRIDVGSSWRRPCDR